MNQATQETSTQVWSRSSFMLNWWRCSWRKALRRCSETYGGATCGKARAGAQRGRRENCMTCLVSGEGRVACGVGACSGGVGILWQARKGLCPHREQRARALHTDSFLVIRDSHTVFTVHCREPSRENCTYKTRMKQVYPHSFCLPILQSGFFATPSLLSLVSLTVLYTLGYST